MKKSNILIIIIIIIAGLLATLWVIGYDSLVKSKKDVYGESSNISVQLKRKVDLIEKLVISEKLNPEYKNNINSIKNELIKADNIDKKININKDLTTIQDNIIVIIENTPSLKESQNYKSIQQELIDNKARTKEAKKDYNTAVKEYNKKIKVFPTNIIAKLIKYEEEKYYK